MAQLKAPDFSALAAGWTDKNDRCDSGLAERMKRAGEMNVTVAICTWNRASLLDQTLARMLDLSVPAELQWELLIVNNRCSDSTDEVISRHQDRLPLKRLWEPRQGLSYARNLALAEARSDLLIFCDDDVLVSPGWLAAYAAAAGRWPQAGFFAGPVYPWYEQQPEAHVAAVLNELARGAWLGVNLGEQERAMTPGEGLRGANLAIRRSAAAGLEFVIAYGRTANQVWFGDEMDFCDRIHRRGAQGVWVPAAQLQHFVPAGRLSEQYLRGYFQGLGRWLVQLGEIGNGDLRWSGIPRWVLRRSWEARLAKWFHFLARNQEAHFRRQAELWRLEGIVGACRDQSKERDRSQENAPTCHDPSSLP